MKREEEIIDAGIEYTLSHHPVCIGGGAFADEMREFNRSAAFEAGAKWADESMIAKAARWLKDQEEMIGISFEEDFLERFKEAMEE